MRLTLRRSLLCAWVAVFLLAGCAASMPAADRGSDPVADKPYESRLEDAAAKALFHYGRAMLLLGDGEVDEAVAALSEAIRFDPESEDLRFLLAQIYGESGRLKEARRTLEDILIRDPQSIQAHLALGHISLSHDAPQQAAEHFRRVMELDPDDAMVPLHLSIALVRSGEADQAIEVLKELLRTHPDSRPGRLTLARLYRDMDLHVLAEEQYRYLIDNLDDPDQAYLDLGFMYESQRDWGEALRLFREALERNPHNLALRHHLARIYVSMGELEKALGELEIIVRFDAADIEARRKIGLIYMEQKRWNDAAAQFQDILERAPDLQPARYYLGSALEYQQDWEAALEAFSAIPETSALYEDAISHMGFLLMKTGRGEDAVALLEDHLERGDPRPQNFYYLAIMHLSEDRFDRALSVLDQATRQFPDDADLLYQKGITLERMKRHEQAIEVMQAVIRLDEEHAEAMNFIAYAYAEADTHLEQALSLAERAIKLKPAAHIHDTLGWVYFRLERYQEARREIEEALRQLPEDEVVLSHLAEIYMVLREFDKAREIYEKLHRLSPEKHFPKEMPDVPDTPS